MPTKFHVHQIVHLQLNRKFPATFQAAQILRWRSHGITRSAHAAMVWNRMARWAIVTAGVGEIGDASQRVTRDHVDDQ